MYEAIKMKINVKSIGTKNMKCIIQYMWKKNYV